MNWGYLTFPSSSRGILSSSSSNSSSVISTPNLKQTGVSSTCLQSSHLGQQYPQYPEHMAAINSLLLLWPSRSRAPREYQRLIRVLIASAFSKKEILPQNPSIGGAQKQKYQHIELCAIVLYKKLFITLKHWYCFNQLTLKGFSFALFSMKENVEKNCRFGKWLLSAFGKHFIMALKTFCIQIFKSGSVYSLLFIQQESVFTSSEQ